MAKLSPSRLLAYNVLVDVLTHQRNPAECYTQHLSQHGHIKPVDRTLAYEIIYGSLRWWLKIYTMVSGYSRRNLDHSSTAVKVALVAGSYQIQHLSRVPHRASVNESVEYVKVKQQHSAAAYVNGILRKVAAQTHRPPITASDQHPVEHLAYSYAFPTWMVRRWIRRFNREKLENLLQISTERPPITVRISALTHCTSPQLFRQLSKEAATKPLRRPLPGCYQLNQLPDFSPHSLFAHGCLTIQDESSQLIAHLVDPAPGDHIVDACAGPGGKLTHIYELAAQRLLKAHSSLDPSPVIPTKLSDEAASDQPQPDSAKLATPSPSGFGLLAQLEQNQRHIAATLAHHPRRLPHITAIEQKLSAFQKLVGSVSRIQAQGIKCIHGDFRRYRPAHPPNKLLLDAPCSGMGVLRRHPEGKLFKTSELIDRMVIKQRKLLEHAWNILAPGGELIYGVCSFELEETEHQLEWLLERYACRIQVVNIHSRLFKYYRRFITKNQLLMIYSGLADGMDGFCAFVVQKIK